MPITSESNNFVVFDDLANNKTLYERIFNTIHSANDPDIDQVISLLEDHKRSVKFRELCLDDLLTDQFDSLLLNVTERCNLRCGYCAFSGIYEDDRTHSEKQLDFKVAKSAIDFFIPRAKEHAYVSFYGGEPLVNQELISEAVEYIKQAFPEKEVRFSMTTNFTLGKRHFDFLVDNDFIIMISLDGNKDIHDKWRKDIEGNGTFDRIYSALEELADKHPEYYSRRVGFSVTVTDPSKILELHAFFSQPIFRNNPFSIRLVQEMFLKEDIFNLEEKIAESTEKIRQLAKIYADNIIHGKENSGFLRGLFDAIIHSIFSRSASELPSELYPKGMCRPGIRKLFVDTDGIYFMCEKVGRRLKLGSVFEGFNPQKAVHAYNRYAAIKALLCEPCWAVRLCDSCAASAKSVDDISIEGQRQMCDNLKGKIIQGLSIYSYLLRNDKEKRYADYYSQIKMEG
ncbi:hypothetical protein COT48_01280 [Candidatus Woesearchaeota archaeon CG08_land_8_20_14_0_20_47_9]|nr:MAG: hypothetical protein AUJ69_04395 [Candidatus Woesearchaeota archaeon CG1_02_47_18]PIO04265.1 MAG: hypothetical protein COT48_01280 [Candidatus Woesearchaeota archaeon CG08_land_8_20_14_0_20_47_9]